MSFCDKPALQDIKLNPNGAIIEVDDGYLKCSTLPVNIPRFKLVDVVPKVKGATTIIKSLSDLVDVASKGYINYRFISGLELVCNLTFSYIETPLQIAIFMAEGHRAKININGNTNYTATTVAEYLDKYLKYVNSVKPKHIVNSNKHEELMDKLDNMNIWGTHGQPYGDGVFYIINNDSCISYNTPCKVHYGLNCSIRPTKDGSKAQIVWVEYDEAYNGSVCIYNNTKTRTKDLPYNYSDEKYKSIITEIVNKHHVKRGSHAKPSFAKVWETLKAMPCFKLNGNTLCLGANNGKRVEARYQDDDILLKLVNNHIIRMRPNLSKFIGNDYCDENTIIRFIKFVAIAELYSNLNFNFEG